DAAIIINVQQVGSDVVATGSGSIDLTGLTFSFAAFEFGRVVPLNALIIEGPVSTTSISVYTGATGPVSFGAGTETFASSGSGDIFAMQGNGGELAVPSGYTSGTSLSATDTYSGRTIANLGLIPGTYNYTWGTGGPTHTLTVQIRPRLAM